MNVAFSPLLQIYKNPNPAKSFTKLQVSLMEKLLLDLKSENDIYKSSLKKLSISSNEVLKANAKLQDGIADRRNHLQSLTTKLSERSITFLDHNFLRETAKKRLIKYYKYYSDKTGGIALDKIGEEIDSLRQKIDELREQEEKIKKDKENIDSILQNILSLGRLKVELENMNLELNKEANKLLNTINFEELDLNPTIENRISAIRVKMEKSEKVRKDLEKQNNEYDVLNGRVLKDNEYYQSLNNKLNETILIFDQLDQLFLNDFNSKSDQSLSKVPPNNSNLSSLLFDTDRVSNFTNLPNYYSDVPFASILDRELQQKSKNENGELIEQTKRENANSRNQKGRPIILRPEIAYAMNKNSNQCLSKNQKASSALFTKSKNINNKNVNKIDTVNFFPKQNINPILQLPPFPIDAFDSSNSKNQQNDVSHKSKINNNNDYSENYDLNSLSSFSKEKILVLSENSYSISDNQNKTKSKLSKNNNSDDSDSNDEIKKKSNLFKKGNEKPNGTKSNPETNKRQNLKDSKLINQINNNDLNSESINNPRNKKDKKDVISSNLENDDQSNQVSDISDQKDKKRRRRKRKKSRLSLDNSSLQSSDVNKAKDELSSDNFSLNNGKNELNYKNGYSQSPKSKQYRSQSATRSKIKNPNLTDSINIGKSQDDSIINTTNYSSYSEEDNKSKPKQKHSQNHNYHSNSKNKIKNKNSNDLLSENSYDEKDNLVKESLENNDKNNLKNKSQTKNKSLSKKAKLNSDYDNEYDDYNENDKIKIKNKNPESANKRSQISKPKSENENNDDKINPQKNDSKNNSDVDNDTEISSKPHRRRRKRKHRNKSKDDDQINNNEFENMNGSSNTEDGNEKDNNSKDKNKNLSQKKINKITNPNLNDEDYEKKEKSNTNRKGNLKSSSSPEKSGNKNKQQQNDYDEYDNANDSSKNNAKPHKRSKHRNCIKNENEKLKSKDQNINPSETNDQNLNDDYDYDEYESENANSNKNANDNTKNNTKPHKRRRRKNSIKNENEELKSKDQNKNPSKTNDQNLDDDEYENKNANINTDSNDSTKNNTKPHKRRRRSNSVKNENEKLKSKDQNKNQSKAKDQNFNDDYDEYENANTNTNDSIKNNTKPHKRRRRKNSIKNENEEIKSKDQNKNPSKTSIQNLDDDYYEDEYENANDNTKNNAKPHKRRRRSNSVKNENEELKSKDQNKNPSKMNDQNLNDDYDYEDYRDSNENDRNDLNHDSLRKTPKRNNQNKNSDSYNKKSNSRSKTLKDSNHKRHRIIIDDDSNPKDMNIIDNCSDSHENKSISSNENSKNQKEQHFTSSESYKNQSNSSNEQKESSKSKDSNMNHSKSRDSMFTHEVDDEDEDEHSYSNSTKANCLQSHEKSHSSDTENAFPLNDNEGNVFASAFSLQRGSQQAKPRPSRNIFRPQIGKKDNNLSAKRIKGNESDEELETISFSNSPIRSTINQKDKHDDKSENDVSVDRLMGQIRNKSTTFNLSKSQLSGQTNLVNRDDQMSTESSQNDSYEHHRRNHSESSKNDNESVISQSESCNVSSFYKTEATTNIFINKDTIEETDPFANEVRKAPLPSQTKWAQDLLRSAISRQLNLTRLHVAISEAQYQLSKINNEIMDLEDECLMRGFERRVRNHPNLRLVVPLMTLFVPPSASTKTANMKRSIPFQTKLTGKAIMNDENEIIKNNEFLAKESIIDSEKMICNAHLPMLEKALEKLLRANDRMDASINQYEEKLGIVDDRNKGKNSKETRLRMRYERALNEARNKFIELDDRIAKGFKELEDTKSLINDQRELHQKLKEKIEIERKAAKPNVPKMTKSLNGYKAIEKWGNEKIRMMQLEEEYLDLRIAEKSNDLDIDKLEIRNSEFLAQINALKDKFFDSYNEFCKKNRMKSRKVRKLKKATSENEIEWLNKKIKLISADIEIQKSKKRRIIDEVKEAAEKLVLYKLNVPPNSQLDMTLYN